MDFELAKAVPIAIKYCIDNNKLMRRKVADTEFA
jgi:hypothetical protein